MKFDGNFTGVIDIEMGKIEKALADMKLRIVKLTDVTIEKEQLVKALLDSGAVPGNMCRTIADTLLKKIVTGKLEEVKEEVKKEEE